MTSFHKRSFKAYQKDEKYKELQKYIRQNDVENVREFIKCLPYRKYIDGDILNLASEFGSVECIEDIVCCQPSLVKKVDFDENGIPKNWKWENRFFAKIVQNAFRTKTRLKIGGKMKVVPKGEACSLIPFVKLNKTTYILLGKERRFSPLKNGLEIDRWEIKGNNKSSFTVRKIECYGLYFVIHETNDDSMIFWTVEIDGDYIERTTPYRFNEDKNVLLVQRNDGQIISVKNLFFHDGQFSEFGGFRNFDEKFDSVKTASRKTDEETFGYFKREKNEEILKNSEKVRHVVLERNFFNANLFLFPLNNEIFRIRINKETDLRKFETKLNNRAKKYISKTESDVDRKLSSKYRYKFFRLNEVLKCFYEFVKSLIVMKNLPCKFEKVEMGRRDFFRKKFVKLLNKVEKKKIFAGVVKQLKFEREIGSIEFDMFQKLILFEKAMRNTQNKMI